VPQPLKRPYLLHANMKTAAMLGIDTGELAGDDFIAYMNAERFFKGAEPFAMCYAGHQFGYYVDRLGDGRAVNIGTLKGWHLQLKGAGKTAYSRHGDGRAVLRSSIREYLASEAMQALGIPTTRALAILGSKQQVYRDMDWEEGAIVCRLSKSWVRFGTFEYFARKGKIAELEALAAYAIEENYPRLADKPRAVEAMYDETVRKTAALIAQWMAIGFTHGVMNTDNMSVAGVTIDYGPYGFLDAFDGAYVPNRTDTYGRYRFGAQPAVAEWNLKALLDALLPIADGLTMQRSLERYWEHYTRNYEMLMAQKLGFARFERDDSALLKQLLDTMQALRIDYTRFFYLLRRYEGDRTPLLQLGLYHRPLHDWLDRYDERIADEDVRTRRARMCEANPVYIPRAYMLQEAIEAAMRGDASVMQALFEVLTSPYEIREGYERWAEPAPEMSRNTQLSCSS
jgi:uncharacterized protein YdiU (UPF0061 family)